MKVPLREITQFEVGHLARTEEDGTAFRVATRTYKCRDKGVIDKADNVSSDNAV